MKGKQSLNVLKKLVFQKTPTALTLLFLLILVGTIVGLSGTIKAEKERITAEKMAAGSIERLPVNVVLLDVVPREVPDGIPFVVLGKLLDDRAGQCCEIARRRIVIVVGQAGGIRETTRQHADRCGTLVHHIGKDAFGTGHVLGQCHARIVAGLHDHAEQQVFDPHPFADLDEHARPAGLP